ncbi:DNA-binding protein [Photorhabdus hindustanensis]|uniref:DNA-binding protein n=2 Tax=Morganellaceae TaxID=1903414 RepID=A0A2S8Q7Y3_9GAMM|nr:helix-turn-helix transcriptional regulator [Photorhabdus aegyptia]PQQ28916.1 DNA-binding protein [Photorhabdus hindustanensis]
MALMLYTESELLAELGNRLREHRLRRNMLQTELALRSGISVSALKKLEASGQGTLENFMKVAFALRLEDEVKSLFMPQPVSIAQLEAMKAPVRQRARRTPRSARKPSGNGRAHQSEGSKK